MSARAALSTVADRLALIIPRLGSTHDGEVIASVRAIGRVLNGAGLDWHDMAAAITARGIAPPRSRNRTFGGADEAVAPLWNELDESERITWVAAINGHYCLSDRDRNFLADVLSCLHAASFRASPKQTIQLNRLIARAFAMGLRP